MGGERLDANGVNEHGVAMCECGEKRSHAWEPGESCSPERVVPQPDYKLPEGVERFEWFSPPGNELGYMHPREDGDWIRVSDLPAILSQERQRVREGLEDALDLIERLRGGDEELTSEDYYARRDRLRAELPALDSLEVIGRG